MKTFNKLLIGLASVALALTACSDFEDINKNPNSVSEENVQVAHLLNKSFMGGSAKSAYRRTYLCTCMETGSPV